MIQETIQKISFDRREAARRLGISIPTIDRELARKKISHFRIGRRVLFTEEHISEYIKRNTKEAK